MFEYDDVKTQFESLWGRKFEHHFTSENINPVLQFDTKAGTFTKNIVVVDDDNTTVIKKSEDLIDDKLQQKQLDLKLLATELKALKKKSFGMRGMSEVNKKADEAVNQTTSVLLKVPKGSTTKSNRCVTCAKCCRM